MPRNRIIYQSLALYATQNTGLNSVTGTFTGLTSNPAAGFWERPRQLTRIQSWDSDFSRSFTDVNQYGQLAAIDRIEVEAPTVNMSTSWYLTNGLNERLVGLSVTPSGTASGNVPSVLSGILTKATDERNYFLSVVAEGNDAVGYNATAPSTGAFGVGNAFLTSFSIEASVGEIPTASAEFEAFNFRVYSGLLATTGAQSPAIIKESGTNVGTGSRFLLPSLSGSVPSGQITVLRPGDITLNLKPSVANQSFVKGFDVDDIKVQSFTLTADLSRTPIERLGSRFPFSREIDFPLTASLSIDAQIGDLNDFNLNDLLCENYDYDLSIVLRQNNCTGVGDPAIIASLRGAKLLSQNITTSIGDNASFTAEYEVSIGGPQESARGIFISGSYPAALF